MRVPVTAALALTLFILAGAAGQAQVLLPPAPQTAAPPPQQSPPGPGFVSAYEITRTLRSAGFDPLAPPLREGTIYVARATDYRGILMRVVLDARTGAIRDANRILPGPGSYGGGYGVDRYGESYGPGPYEPYDSGPYGPGPDGPGAYGRVGVAQPPGGPPPDTDGPPLPTLTHSATGASVMPRPRPRPRPPELAARKPADDAKPAAAVAPKAAVAIDAKPDAKAAATTAAPVAPPAPPPQAAAPTPPPQVVAPPAKPGKAPSTLTINN